LLRLLEAEILEHREKHLLAVDRRVAEQPHLRLRVLPFLRNVVGRRGAALGLPLEFALQPHRLDL
jgi:hypothetical protein